MNVTEEWWSEHCISDGEDEEGAVEIDGEYLTHVVYVEVSLPWGGPKRNNPDCYIYGHISFNVGLSDEPVTLYHRERDNPDLLNLSGSYATASSYLSLTDGHKGDRALGAITKSNPLYLNMKLYEKKGSSEGEDELLADFENYECYDSHHDEDYCSYLRVVGESGYRFLVCYTMVFGARAEIEIKIEKEGGLPLNREVPMWGDITAWQYLKKPCAHFTDTVSGTTLLKVYENEEVTYNVDEPIELERRFVVAPMLYQKYLGITLEVETDGETPDVDEDTILVHRVYFPFPLRDSLEVHPFMTNKDLTHTRYIEHVPGTSFSVSIKFVRP